MIDVEEKLYIETRNKHTKKKNYNSKFHETIFFLLASISKLF